MRSKVWHANNPSDVDEDGTEARNFGFKSTYIPEAVEGLQAFEKDVIDMLRKIQYSKRTNDFQQQLGRDVKEIRDSQSIYVSADKTSNMYLMPKDRYGKLLRDNITQK